eukprot:9616631-Lingulodinium_polyedra.AAC.1
MLIRILRVHLTCKSRQTSPQIQQQRSPVLACDIDALTRTARPETQVAKRTTLETTGALRAIPHTCMLPSPRHSVPSTMHANATYIAVCRTRPPQTNAFGTIHTTPRAPCTSHETQRAAQNLHQWKHNEMVYTYQAD